MILISRQACSAGDVQQLFAWTSDSQAQLRGTAPIPTTTKKESIMSNIINRARDARRQDNGFTLIELLIVIVILGVLAAIVVFSVRGITDTGEEAACEANYKTALTAIE